ncbi:pentapeptide repeat-containing protein [Hyalangium versicolor]|uniref:pentapeptide repeat-containing protein n=1 Tax=Hyalangium versicolor TaxID=2861190 RepID=UPI001CC9E711|nr:pentapeptide repeat-containing protein [Hyalangium versicolor]
MSRARVDVLIVTALKEELDAVLELEFAGKRRDAWIDARDYSGFRYHHRELPNNYGETLHVAAAWSGSMGENAAAFRAVALIQELDPVCLAMCGICAGRREGTFLGDVIVADRVFSYDHGKLIASKRDRDVEFLHDIATYNLEAAWKMDAAYFAEEFTQSLLAKTRPVSMDAQRRWLLRVLEAHEKRGGPSPVDHPDRRTQCPDWAECIQALRKQRLIKTVKGELQLTEKGWGRVREELLLDPEGQQGDPPFRVHVAPIATGKLVQEDPDLFKRLSRHVRKVLGAEMEAAAIGFVAEQLGRRSIIVKAVSDYADHDKTDRHRSFACHASASFLLAFLRKHLRPIEQEQGPTLIEDVRDSFEGDDGGQDDRGTFLGRVEQICLLHEPAGTKLIRRVASAPFEEFLEVAVPEGRQFTRVFPLAVLDRPVTEEFLEAFIKNIHELYRRHNPSTVSRLIYTGPPAPQSLVQKGDLQRIEVISFAEYLGLIDFSGYLAQQKAKLERDPVYPPSIYVEQRAQVSIGGQEASETQNVLATLLDVLKSPQPRVALVLGDSGAGKTFLLHELARRLSKENGWLIPVLIEMRALQKQRTLRQLIAQHFAAADVPRFEMERFLCMLREGRIALLFDGFDELALRVTYDRVMEHFSTLVEAAQGRAKVVITSRTQHFLTDHEIKRELAQRAEVLPGYRLVKLERFQEQQIRNFLAKRFGGEEAAETRMTLLRSVRDLLGLSENPRLLSFIADLDEKTLRAARTGVEGLTPAKLYEVLIGRWLEMEHQRVNPAGAPRGLSIKQLWEAATELAVLLWGRTERAVSIGELPEELLSTVSAWGAHSLDAEVVRHQLGSGTLLVRDEDGRVSFVHQSVLEWLVARAAAKELGASGNATLLDRSEMSDLLADFFIVLAGHNEARIWAQARSSQADSFAMRNALRVLGRLPEPDVKTEPHDVVSVLTRLKGSDLRGQNLTGVDLVRANLQEANLSGVTLVKGDMTEANLKGARLGRANLVRAKLRNANLEGADLTEASLLGADLRGAVLRGAKFRFAKLTASKMNSLEGSDTFGAALPSVTDAEPNVGLASACFSVAWSPVDDALIATGHSDGSIRFWDALTGRIRRVLGGHTEPVRSVAFSLDGTLLVAASNDWTLTLWSVGEGRLLHDLHGHNGPVLSVAFSPDGSMVASGSADQTISLWSVKSGEVLRTLHGHQDMVRSVAFSPGGAMLASGSADSTAILWGVGQGEVLHVLRGHMGPVRSVAFSPDGMLLASGSDDRTITLWTVGWGQPLRVFREHTAAVLAVAFTPEGKTLGSASADQSLMLWSTSQEHPLRVLKRHSGQVSSLAFNRGGKVLASASMDRKVILWNVSQGSTLSTLRGHVPAMVYMSFGPSGMSLACSSGDQSLTLWNMMQGKPYKSLKGLQGNVNGIVFSPVRDDTLVVACDNGTVAVWDATRGEARSMLQGMSSPAPNMAFSSDGALLALADGEQAVRVWDLKSKSPQVVAKHIATVKGVAFSPDSKTLALIPAGRTAILWSLGRDSALGVLEGHSEQVLSVVFSPDGEWLASTSEDHTVVLWSMSEDRSHRTLREHAAPVLSAAFSPDGKLLASGSMDRTVLLWSVKHGRALHVLRGHSHSVVGVAFNPEGTVLASASNDGVVCLWHVSTGTRLATLVKFPDGWVAFRPDGRFKGGGDMAGAFWHTIGLCRFEPGELDFYLPTLLRIPDYEPFLPKV